MLRDPFIRARWSRSRMPPITSMELPKAEHAAAEWQAAMESLLLVVDLVCFQGAKRTPATSGLPLTLYPLPKIRQVMWQRQLFCHYRFA
jgi:hypothetical protein